MLNHQNRQDVTSRNYTRSRHGHSETLFIPLLLCTKIVINITLSRHHFI
ncbi:hypothetical protein HanPSC8_Chr00c041g0802881 [Helianthus annuus]|nr:hypothetical protein HanPSC8_Chr00c041g0802881 [Helianthus annuus]